MTGLIARIRSASLAGKLTALGVFSTAASMLLAAVVLASFEVSAERGRLARDLVTMTDIVCLNSTAAVSFSDAKAASETLAALRANQRIIRAAIVQPDGKVLARYDRDHATAATEPNFPELSQQNRGDYSPQFAIDRVRVTRPIQLELETVGSVYLESDVTQFVARAQQYLTALSIAFIAALGLSAWLSVRFQRFISGPLLTLTNP